MARSSRPGSSRSSCPGSFHLRVFIYEAIRVDEDDECVGLARHLLHLDVAALHVDVLQIALAPLAGRHLLHSL
eukprot:740892-Heterocapsa_arctica.AAC.1